MSINYKIKISLFCLLILFVSAVFTARIILKNISGASGQLATEKKNLFTLESKIKSLENFRQEYEELKPDLEKADSLLVQAQLPVDFIQFLEEISSEAGINLKISPLADIKITGDPWPSSNFQLSLAGSYPKIIRFIDKLENSQYLITLQSLNFSKLTDMELKSKEFASFFSGDAKGNISLKVYTK